jgi:TonB-dependent SusC/RagA subfamily outer membrane receptor
MFAVTLRFAAVVALATAAACASVSNHAKMDVMPAFRPNVITSDVIAAAGAVSLEQLIADRIPGIQLDHTSDGRLRLHIRGTASWSAADQPLYVVDGFPLMSTIGGPPMIFTSDVQRLEVLKDAASTAMYGNRGAAGVILIETKRR